jgi:hypothetical protein
VLDQNAFVMKGEIADSDTTWRGNPARAVGGGAARVKADTSQAFVAAKVA